MKIGGWFKDCDKVQKSVRRDPHPGVPFCDAKFPSTFNDKCDALIVSGIVVIVVCFIIGVWVI